MLILNFKLQLHGVNVLTSLCIDFVFYFQTPLAAKLTEGFLFYILHILNVARVKLLIVVQKELHQLRVTVRPVEVDRFVERTDAFKVFRRQGKIEHV